MTLKEFVLFNVILLSPLMYIAYDSYDYKTTNDAHWKDCIAKFHAGTVRSCSSISPKYTAYEG